MDRKKKIVLVIPSLGAGGMERVMAELAAYFANQSNIDLHLVLYGIKRDVFYQLPDNISIHKPAFEFNNSRRIVSSIKTLLFLRKKLTSLQAHSILSFGEFWNSFVLLSVLGKKLPVYVSDRCQPDKYLGKVHDFLRRKLYPKSAGIISQTEIGKSIYLKNIRHNNIEVIGNPIRNIQVGNNIFRENVVLSVGRLINSKHHDELIKLFVKLKVPGWKLVIVGDDAIKQNNMVRLRALIQELKADDRVVLAGNQSNVDSYYLRSKIFAFTSSSEGFPNVVGEAQSAGLPVVSFDCVAGPSEMIADGKNGFLVPLYNYDLFAEKLKHLMESDNLQNEFGVAAKQAIQRFNVESIGNHYLNFITGR